MKNPLRKRLLRELKNDIGKYLVIFLFMTATIGFVSGFLVADESMLYAYDESFEKYNVENGNFTTEQKLTDNQRTRLEKEKVTIYENFYKDEDADTDLDSEPESTIRLFKTRTEVNLVCLMKGEMPQQKDEIAIDRMYADNNDLQVGDVISVDKKELTVTGLVALSDYSALFSNSSDMMFDAVKFGVGIMTEEGSYFLQHKRHNRHPLLSEGSDHTSDCRYHSHRAYPAAAYSDTSFLQMLYCLPDGPE